MCVHLRVCVRVCVYTCVLHAVTCSLLHVHCLHPCVASSPSSLCGFLEIRWSGGKKENLVQTVCACANLIAEKTCERKEMMLVDVKLHGRGLMQRHQLIVQCEHGIFPGDNGSLLPVSA